MALTRPKLDNINTTLSRFADPVLTINTANSSQHDAGFIIDRSGISRDPVGLIWDSTNQTFKFAVTTSNGVADGNLTITSLADLEVGNLTVGNIALANAIVDSSLTIERYATDGPDLVFYAARGTESSPSAVQIGDPLFNVFANARNNTGDFNVAQLVAQSTGTDTANITIKLSDGSQLKNSAIFTSTGVEIPGNLIVRGVTTTINTEQLTIQDNNIVIAANANTAAEADGAGFTINGANVGITYSASADYLLTNVNVAFTNNLTVANSVISSNLFANSVQFGVNYTGNVLQGEIAWNADDETVVIGLLDDLHIHIGEDSFYRVKANNSVSAGAVVYFDGVQGENLLVSPADASNPNFRSDYVVGLATKAIAGGSSGFVLREGKLKNVNTGGYTAGTVLYYDPTTQGGWTNAQPIAPNPKIQIAAVLKQDATEGILQVRITRQPGLGELRDVNTANVVIGNYLYYSVNGRWESSPLRIQDDLSPNLGGNLDANGFTITNVASITVTGNVNANYFFGNVDLGTY